MKFTGYLLQLLLTTVFSFNQSWSTTDTQKEKFFHDMYSKFNSEPTPRGTWSRMVSQSRISTYQVQPGDTLWDISTTLFADPQFWPKLWAENSRDILNPHQLEPGKKIFFYGGSVHSPPYFAPQVEEETSQVSLSNGSVTPALKSKKKNPLLQNIPPSFAELKILPTPMQFPDLSPEFGKKIIADPQSPLTAYVADLNFEAIKEKIVDIEQGSSTATLGDILFVELHGPPQKVYHIISFSELDQRKEPRIIHVQGELEILGKASSIKEIYKARITQVIGQISKENKLLSGSLPRFSTSSRGGRLAEVRGQVIGGSLPKNQILYVGQIAFIDAGESQGIVKDDLLKVFLNPNLRVGRYVSDMNYKSIGLMKVVQTTENFSTAYILDASDDIRTGDWVGLTEENDLKRELE